MLPVYHAVHPDSSDVASKSVLKILGKMDISRLMYKISTVVSSHAEKSHHVAQLGTEISQSLQSLIETANEVKD